MSASICIALTIDTMVHNIKRFPTDRDNVSIIFGRFWPLINIQHQIIWLAVIQLIKKEMCVVIKGPFAFAKYFTLSLVFPSIKDWTFFKFSILSRILNLQSSLELIRLYFVTEYWFHPIRASRDDRCIVFELKNVNFAVLATKSLT